MKGISGGLIPARTRTLHVSAPSSRKAAAGPGAGGCAEGDGDVAGLMTISEWDGVEEESRGHR